MADAPTVPDPALPAPAPNQTLLDPQKLDVYRVAVEFQLLTAQLVPRRGHFALRDQLERASLSIVLNIAEGAGHFSPADKARFYAMAQRASYPQASRAPRGDAESTRGFSYISLGESVHGDRNPEEAF